MKWLLFLLSLFALFVANNALFWLPGKYNWFSFVMAGTAIAVAAACAWFSGKRFAKSAHGMRPRFRDVVMTLPATIWIVVIFLFCLFGLTKIAGNWSVSR